MDTNVIISTEGYRYEDLSEESKKKLDIYHCAIDDLQDGVENLLMDFGDSVIEQIRKETVEDAVEELTGHMQRRYREMQIFLAEEGDG